jgi:hypothetical protein
MKYTVMVRGVVPAATIGCAQSPADSQTNAPVGESSGKP